MHKQAQTVSEGLYYAVVQFPLTIPERIFSSLNNPFIPWQCYTGLLYQGVCVYVSVYTCVCVRELNNVN